MIFSKKCVFSLENLCDLLSKIGSVFHNLFKSWLQRTVLWLKPPKDLKLYKCLEATSTECRWLPLCPQNGNLHFKLASHYLPCHFKGKLVLSVETFSRERPCKSPFTPNSRYRPK